ncbi:hypothetical protein OC861_006244 [Tilletia horrida]|nr:hypothetical protein OC861_006244 [Tilletia horrida]
MDRLAASLEVAAAGQIAHVLGNARLTQLSAQVPDEIQKDTAAEELVAEGAALTTTATVHDLRVRTATEAAAGAVARQHGRSASAAQTFGAIKAGITNEVASLVEAARHDTEQLQSRAEVVQARIESVLGAYESILQAPTGEDAAGLEQTFNDVRQETAQLVTDITRYHKNVRAAADKATKRELWAHAVPLAASIVQTHAAQAGASNAVQRTTGLTFNCTHCGSPN